ncbi:hypothetical protein LOC71_19015 [Rhodopirellula sp. JC740]|uniref:Transposase n=1 Tax=Rhodopirellula halodulae TaxID=2894198 RepID=A0ABS8NLC6_9BACT|nr:hypothetical protein [Rhodopirellula sp. JC740]MCC9644374.1 hypothetical protein [Rhodopirellula sp. JC740]
MGVTPPDQLPSRVIEFGQTMLQRREHWPLKSITVVQSIFEQFEDGIIPNRSRPALTSMLANEIRGNTQQPRPERFVEIDLSPFPPQQHEHFLSQIVSLERVIDPYSHERPHRRFMSGDDVFEVLQIGVGLWCQ